MKELPGTLINEFPLKNLEWVKDIHYYDGPLSSHFKNLDDNYLVSWCDKIEDSHRFIIIKVPISVIDKLMESDYELFPIENLDDHVIFTDVKYDNKELIHHKTSIAKIDEVPTDYFPHGFVNIIIKWENINDI